MSTINIDLRSAVGTKRPEDLLMQNIAHASVGDVVSITVDRTRAHEVDGLFNVLEHEGFEVLPKGGQDEYNILAQRRSN